MDNSTGKSNVTTGMIRGIIGGGLCWLKPLIIGLDTFLLWKILALGTNYGLFSVFKNK
jgi:hypothetical protein